MGFVVIVTIGVVIVAVAFLLPERDTAATAPAEPEPAAAGAPTSLEGALAAQLMAGGITPGQYRTALTRLAERDEERNPLVLPGNDLF